MQPPSIKQEVSKRPLGIQTLGRYIGCSGGAFCEFEECVMFGIIRAGGIEASRPLLYHGTIAYLNDTAQKAMMFVVLVP